MRRIFAVMCIKNEADRYLQSCLAWNAQWWDELFVFDDQSEDQTPRIAAQFGQVTVRSDNEPSFLDHEGQFRAAAWRHFEEALAPNEEDWVFAIDADEFLVTNFGSISLHSLADEAESYARESVAIHVPEAWEYDDDLQIRVDGFWNDNWNPRFCKWRPGGTFNDRSMGSGSTPGYAWSNPYRTIALVNLLHVGYLNPDERQIRYERYMNHPDGHNPAHIQSIIEQPSLIKWEGPTPNMWRGER